MLDLVTVALHAERPREESHRLAVAASQIDQPLSANQFQLLFHETDMPVEGWYVHS